MVRMPSKKFATAGLVTAVHCSAMAPMIFDSSLGNASTAVSPVHNIRQQLLILDFTLQTDFPAILTDFQKLAVKLFGTGLVGSK